MGHDPGADGFCFELPYHKQTNFANLGGQKDYLPTHSSLMLLCCMKERPRKEVGISVCVLPHEAQSAFLPCTILLYGHPVEAHWEDPGNADSSCVWALFTLMRGNNSTDG